MQWMLGGESHPICQKVWAFGSCKSESNLEPSHVTDADYSFGYDYRVRALASLARVLWLRGYPDQAVHIGGQALEDAYNLQHPATICLSLIYVSTVFLWIGDWKAAQQTIDKLILKAEQNAFETDHAAGVGLKGILLICQGQVDAGIPLLHNCLNVLSIGNHQVLTTMFVKSLAEGFAAKGRYANALEVAGGALEMMENVGETFDTPEILRVIAELYALRPNPDLALAEQYLNRSLACAERQSALAWELRAAISLTRLQLLQGRNTEAGDLLQSVYCRFTEGFDSADMCTAKQLLHSLSRPEKLKVMSWELPLTRPSLAP